MSTTVTRFPMFPNACSTLAGKVIGADATATTYVLDCRPGEDCGRLQETITVGPWAEKTLPPGAASTGVYDSWLNDTISDGTRFTASMHCEMVRSVAQECTMSSGPIKDSKDWKKKDFSPVTYTDEKLFREISGPTMIYGEVILTAGLELLARATATSSSVEATQSTTTQTGSSTVSTDVPEETNNARKIRLHPFLAAGVGALFALSLWG
ncbi:hypothetical protein FLONG3_5020 [Fusarium longipes]|uniref:Uncharacterized protein n=1 Tax=Fusarium longipes TaxID=694270 RepID=A0A395SXK6_9HYPO|nr:hypothetical protein FLONG3_5020 [Fusarium longipes]